MPRLISELIISLDGCARATKSPGYYGLEGPDFMAWLTKKSSQPHRNILGRKTYEMMNGLPDKERDESYNQMTGNPGWVYSRTLTNVDWPGLEVIKTDAIDHLREKKSQGGDELRILGSLSLMRQAAAAGILDTLRLMVFPVAVPETGIEHIFKGMDDTQFKLADTKILDGRTLVLDYAPDGSPPVA